LALGAVALMIALAPSTAAAQTTADGVAAFDRGDYVAAAALLRPITERFPLHDDPTAEFLMAQMYETGRGVPLDRVRAYALYARAMSGLANRRAMDAMEHARALYFSFERTDAERGDLLINLGFRHGFEPATFELESGHWVAVDLQEVIIHADADERHIAVNLAPAIGMVFLPLVHSELSVTQPVAARRHFVEVAAWRPDLGRHTWTLFDQIFEVTRTDWVQVGFEDELATMAAADPPRSSVIQDFVQIRVAARGAVEAVTLGGPHPGTHHIESESERRVRIESARMRDDALRRVDWTAKRDTQRTPALTYGEADGCDSAFVFGWSADRAEVITIRASQELLQLSSTPQTFALSVPRIGLEVMVHVFQSALQSWPFCTDVGTMYEVPPEVWRAAAGSITIALSSVPAGDARSIRATVHIAGAEFVRGDGVRVTQTAPIVVTGTVGRIAG
jgi:hypothetical protein